MFQVLLIRCVSYRRHAVLFSLSITSMAAALPLLYYEGTPGSIKGVELPRNLGNVREFRCKDKSQGIYIKKENTGERFREFCCKKFIFSQSEHPHPPRHKNSPGHTEEFDRSLGKSGKSQRISFLLETGHAPCLTICANFIK